MDDHNQTGPENGLPLEPADESDVSVPKKKGYTVLSWLVIVGFVGLMIVRSNWKEGPAESAQQERLRQIVFEMQARYLIGAAHSLPVNAKEFYHEAQALDQGSREQRLEFVVVAGELAGPREALHKLIKLQEDLKGSGDQRQWRLAKILQNLYGDYAAGDYGAPSIAEKDREFLRQQLGWFGDLALNPHAEVPPARAAPAGAAPV